MPDDRPCYRCERNLPRIREALALIRDAAHIRADIWEPGKQWHLEIAAREKETKALALTQAMEA